MSAESDIREQCRKAFDMVARHPRKDERHKILEDIITAAMTMRGVTNATIIKDDKHDTLPT